MDGHQWQTKRWREGNAAFRPSEGLFQVPGLWWGRVHIAAVILAVLWGITYNSVWHCRRLWTGSRYLELSCGAAVFSLCSLPQANALEKLELKIIQPFLEAKQRKIGNLFFPPFIFPFLGEPSYIMGIFFLFSFFLKNQRKPWTVTYVPVTSSLFGKMRWP